MKTIEYRSFAIQIDQPETRDDGQSDGLIRGHAIVFNAPSHDLGGFREIVSPTALNRTLGDGHNIYCLWSHNNQMPLGSTLGGKLTLTVDDRGLAFTLDPKRLTPAQLDAFTDGEMRMSFGFAAVEQLWHHTEEGPSIRTLLDIDLFEVSPVISPAYPDTTAALRSLEASKAEPVEEIVAEAVEETVVETIEQSVSERDFFNLELDLLAQTVEV